MPKLLTILGIVFLILGSYAGVFLYGGNYRENKLTLAQANADLILAARIMDQRNDIDTELMESLPSIYNADDGAVTGPAIGKLMQSPSPKRKPVTDPGTP